MCQCVFACVWKRGKEGWPGVIGVLPDWSWGLPRPMTDHWLACGEREEDTCSYASGPPLVMHTLRAACCTIPPFCTTAVGALWPHEPAPTALFLIAPAAAPSLPYFGPRRPSSSPRRLSRWHRRSATPSPRACRCGDRAYRCWWQFALRTASRVVQANGKVFCRCGMALTVVHACTPLVLEFAGKGETGTWLRCGGDEHAVVLARPL